MNRKTLAKRLNHLFLLLIFTSAIPSLAQTSAFTYQGKLVDGGVPANGSYDVQFGLFDAASGTGQIGSTLTLNSVQVAAGIFTVELDFGAAAFAGADRFLEISVRPAAQGGFTTLLPRQKLGSSPYSIKSVNSATAENALNLGGTAASQFVQTNDSRLSDARTPLPGSNDYLRNMVSPQSGVNFNIGGTGTANILRATTQFDIGGSRVLGNSGLFNLFAGVGAGQANTTGDGNSFFGANAGSGNTTGRNNSFFGNQAGLSTTLGQSNSFFGSSVGRLNTTGGGNAFFGNSAGFNNLTGSNNSFFGLSSGFQNTSGSNNAFFGDQTGNSNTTGSRNTLIGFGANVGAGNLNHATAIGSGAIVNTSNTVVLGRDGDLVRVPGFFSVSGDGAIGGRLGVGTATPSAMIHVNGAAEGIRIQGDENAAYLTFVKAAGPALGYVGDGSSGNDDMYLASTAGNVHLYTQIGAALTATPTGNLLMSGGPNVLGPTVNAYAAQTIDTGNFKAIFTPNLFLSSLDTFLPSAVHVCARVQAIGGTGGLALTRCSSPFSSSSDKDDVQSFSGGLNIVRRLNPVTFRSKSDGKSDVGLNAEDVVEVEPLLVERNEKGEAEGVKENGLQVVLINAIKELEERLMRQEKEIETLKTRQQDFDALKKLACQSNPQAGICTEEQK